MLVSVTNGLATVINFLSGGSGLNQNSLAAARSLSTAGSLKFNQAHPEGVPTTACGEGAYTARGVYSSPGWRQVLHQPARHHGPGPGLTSLAFGGARMTAWSPAAPPTWVA